VHCLRDISNVNFQEDIAMTIARSLILLAFTAVPAVSMAQVSANFGMVSDYIYRGIFQSSSSASAGLDFEHDSGFYIG